MLYNFIVVTFAEWLAAQYENWSNETGGDKAAFAKWIGVPPTSLSNWLNGGFKPRGENIAKLADKYGNEIYPVLGLPVPETPMPFDGLPPALREALLSAAREVADSLAAKRIDRDTDEAEVLTVSIMEKHGLKWMRTEKEGP